MSILDILEELAGDNSRLAKEAILKREINNEILKAVLVAALNPYVVYGIKKIPNYTEGQRLYPLSQAIGMLKDLSSRRYTGNAAIEYLAHILSSVNPEDATVIELIIARDLRIGCSEVTVNKIWPGLIPTFDVLLCHKDTSGIKYPAFAQLKGDGMRCHLQYDGENVFAFSRQGQKIDLADHFLETAKKLMKAGEVWDGELLVVDAPGKFLDRKTGNGIINKAVKNTISPEETKMVRFLTWDIVDFAGTISYIDRLQTMNERFNAVNMSSILFIPCPTIIVNSEAEALKFFKQMRAEGAEGAVIKNFDLKWVGDRVKGAGKMKAVEEADLKIVGVIPGKGKYKGMIGSYLCETSDGIIKVAVGSGLTDEQRKETWKNGTIIAVLYNEKIQDKKTGEWSLFLPRFVEVRIDKKVANTFVELK